MAAIILTAKVKLFYEVEMEQNEGVIPPEKGKWVWRQIGIDADEIRMVVRYNKTKSLIRDWYDVETLIDEPFLQVFEKWENNRDGEKHHEKDLILGEKEEGKETEGEDDDIDK